MIATLTRFDRHNPFSFISELAQGWNLFVLERERQNVPELHINHY